MMNRIREERADESPKRGRRGARKCPCCAASPCACEKTCFCQELKGEMMADEGEAETESGGYEDLRFSFLRHGEQIV